MCNKFILFQVPTPEESQQNQIYVVEGNDLKTIASVMDYGAVEVGRVQTTLTKGQFIEGMNSIAALRNARLIVAIQEIKNAIKKAGIE